MCFLSFYGIGSQLCFSFFLKLWYQSCISWQRIRLTCPGLAPPGWSRRCRNGKGLRPQNCQSTSCCALRPHRLDPECSTELYGSHHIHKLVVCCTGKATPCKLVFYCTVKVTVHLHRYWATGLDSYCSVHSFVLPCKGHIAYMNNSVLHYTVKTRGHITDINECSTALQNLSYYIHK